jgi:hypothetical protein
VKAREHVAKSVSMPTCGLHPTLRGLLDARGTGALSLSVPARPDLTIARRLAVLVASLCVLAWVLIAAASAAAAATPFEFGSLGSEAGQVDFPSGVAVDASGDVYVGDLENERVDKFDSSGKFLLAWGAGVADGAEELQTCTTACRKGLQSPVAGGFEFATGVAVDGAGDVYVVDDLHHRIEKFTGKGEFILMFGGHVNKNGADVCTASEASECQAGTQTEFGEPQRDGEFSFWETFGSFIATGPGNKVYVGDTGRVQVFEPSGVWKEDISLAGLSSEGQPTALAVDSAGNVFLHDSQAEGVREFEANGLEKLTQFDRESFSVTALSVDQASGDLYVGDENGGFHVLKYDSAGTELASFGAKTVSGFNGGIAFSTTTSELYASEAVEGTSAGVWVLTAPPAGPLIDSESATPSLKGAATLEAQVNPEGNETTYHLEYVDQAHFQGSGYAGATSTTPETITEGLFEEHPAQVNLPEGTLIPGETYHWRVVATDSLSQTTTGADQSFEETPAALIDGPWSEAVTATSATLAARINPLTADTSYRLEYGTSASYEHVLAGDVGEGNTFVPISYHVQELLPNTTYHYRVVTTSTVGSVQGPDHTFTTQGAGASGSVLPDGRAWELVTPPSTGGAVFELGEQPRHAASDGGAITYGAKGVPLGENVVSNESLVAAQVLSRRGPHGWQSQDINTPIGPTPPGRFYPGEVLDNGLYVLFSSDLASAALFSNPFHGTLTSDALDGTYYLRDNTGDGSYTALLTPANTPPGTDLLVPTGAEEEGGTLHPQDFVAAGTPDLSHLVLESPLKLTEDAVEYVPREPGVVYQIRPGNLYEWSAGRLRLVTILPNGRTDESNEAFLAGEGEGNNGQVPRAISSDGRRVAWTVGTPYGSGAPLQGLFVRDMVEERTVHIGGPGARYQTMSSDGSRVFFLENGDLHVYNAGTPYDAGTTADLTPNHGPGAVSAGVQESVSDVSEDGSSVYFVATGALSSEANATGEKATAGADNLYLLRESGGTWQAPRFIGTLSSEDEPSWHAGSPAPDLHRVSSRVSPDGRYLAFMSSRPLTGYDNVDSNPEAKGARDEEVFLYDSGAGRLVCASCDPSGARPHGVLAGGTKQLLVQRSGGEEWGEVGHPHWLAGNLTGWEDPGSFYDDVYQPRYLSDGGRLFFDSPEALVPQDTNSLEDVYQYEPGGVGSCASAASGERPDGCVNLISSGHSASESAFLDASESGQDVFFLSADHLTSADADTGYDVWDAHVCSASSPCVTPPVSPPPCSSGDSCKPPPSPQPELFGPAPSATFSGAGNLTPVPPVASKRLTRVQKLARALAACRKKHKRKRRRACERTAHKHYGYAAKRSRKANATNRGGK